jgi:hypothetical protein
MPSLSSPDTSVGVAAAVAVAVGDGVGVSVGVGIGVALAVAVGVTVGVLDGPCTTTLVISTVNAWLFQNRAWMLVTAAAGFKKTPAVPNWRNAERGMVSV